uniref:Retrotransposon gag domain-containing protein n=1 Tax=Tanacetum cinerariifolium TaxID=118510 RepID=A0A6L2JWC0_TANCI|nr:hypothetical protein [Tanacetum cinerariifolium]
MRTRSSSNLPVVSPPNPSTSTPNRRNRRRSKQPFILEESPIDTMANQRTMAELLRAPTEGYAEAIVFFGLEKDNPHDHIRWFNKITSTIKYKDVPNSAIKLMLFPFSLAGAARRTINLRNEIFNFQQRFDESFHEAWDRYKDLLRAYPHHGVTELHQLDTFYNALNPADQDYLNAAAGGNLLERRSRSLPRNTVANPKGELKAITNRSGLVLDGPFVPIPPPFINLEVDERVEETLTDQDLAEYTIKEKLQELANTPLNENYSAVILKKLPEKLGDPGKFLIPCGFNELKCKALADLADFVIVDYESDPRVPLILGRLFLRTACALIDVHGEEMILRNGDERLTLNMRHDTSSYSNQPQKESINLINVFSNLSKDFLEDLFLTNQPSCNPTFPSQPELTSPKVKNDIFDPEGGNVLPKKLLDLDSTKDLHPSLHVNPLKYDDDLQFDIEFDLKEIEYLLHHDPINDIDSILKDSIDQSNLADLNNNLVDSMPEMFTDKHALDYSSPSLFDEYDDDLFEVESDTENVNDDPFDSKGEKIKESKLLINELDFLCDFLPFEYDLFLSEDFSRVDALPSTNNEDKVFNPGILIQENIFEIITCVVQDKKLAISHAFLIIKDFDPPLYELPFFKEVPRSNMLLPFSSKNEEKVFKPGIHTSKKVYSSLIPELSHQGYKVFKINQILKSPMKIFLFSCEKDTHILVLPCLYFYPLNQFKYRGIGSC